MFRRRSSNGAAEAVVETRDRGEERGPQQLHVVDERKDIAVEVANRHPGLERALLGEAPIDVRA